MDMQIREKEFDQLADAYIDVWNCVYLLDLLQHSTRNANEGYGEFAHEDARSFLIDPLIVLLTKMEPSLESVSYRAIQDEFPR